MKSDLIRQQPEVDYFSAILKSNNKVTYRRGRLELAADLFRTLFAVWGIVPLSSVPDSFASDQSLDLRGILIARRTTSSVLSKSKAHLMSEGYDYFCS